MSSFLIAFLFAAGAGTWIYSKMYSRTGGNQLNSLLIGGLSGAVLFLLMLGLLAIIGNVISSNF